MKQESCHDPDKKLRSECWANTLPPLGTSFVYATLDSGVFGPISLLISMACIAVVVLSTNLVVVQHLWLQVQLLETGLAAQPKRLGRIRQQSKQVGESCAQFSCG